MSRKYDEQLVQMIKDKQYLTSKRGVKVIVKPIPDLAIKGAMDPRLYQSIKKMNLLVKFIPKSFLKVDMSLKSIHRLRKFFNRVSSRQMVREPIEQIKKSVGSEDGYEIPITIFKSSKTMENAPILYFIHGGGFFAGSTEVVSEALKLFVAKSGMIAVGVDYRLAPENPYPIGHQDCYRVLQWLGKHAFEFGGDNKNIFVGGDSAGGNLTLYCSNREIEEGGHLVKGQILLYPTVNMGGIQDEATCFSIDEIDIYEKQASIIKPGIEKFGEAINLLKKLLGAPDVMNKDLTPYMEVNPDSPVTLMSAGEHDFLTIESLAYAKKLQEVGVDVTFTYYCGLGHAYLDHVGNYPQAEDCVDDMVSFIQKNRG